MRSLPLIGVTILAPIKLLQPTLPIIRGHHERRDVKGYPDGLRGEVIPIGARIVAVADAYDALKSNRPYRQAFTLPKARSIMEAGAGTQWDEEVVATLLAVQSVVKGAYISQSSPVVDPVCSMAVTLDQAPASVNYHDHMFYFCSITCQEVFDKNPEDFV